MNYRALFAVWKKEIKSYIDHPLAYILVVVFLVANSFLYFRTSFVEEIASIRSMVNLFPWIALLFIPALTMRAWAEERRAQTLGLLLSYPVRLWEVVAGKLLATTMLLAVALALTLPIAFSLSRVGDFDGGVVFAQYLGMLLLGFSMTAVGQWASTLTKNQVVAFIVSIAVLFAFYLVSLDIVLLSLPYPLNVVGQQLGMLSHFNAMARGVVDARDVLYFLSVSFVFGLLSFAWLMRLKRTPSSPQWRKLQSTVAVMVAICIVVNLFGQTWTVRADMTEQDLYSLSGATKSVLRDLDDTVRITFYRSKKLPTQVELISRDVQDMLADYRKYGGGNVDLKIVYPDQDEDAAADAQQKGVPQVRFNVVRQDEFTLQQGYLGLAMEYLDKREVIPLVQTTDDLEYRLTRNILSMQNSEKPKVGLVSDFGGKSLEEWNTFASQLRENYTLEQVVLSESEENGQVDQIDESIDVLIVAAPTQTYSEAAISEIKRYIARGGEILFFLSGTIVNQQTLGVTANNTGLEPILTAGGITVQKDVVADLASHETVRFSDGQAQYFFPYPFWIRALATKHVLAGNVQQVMAAWPSSLSIAESAKERIFPVVTTSENGVHLTSNFQLNPNTLPDFSSMETREYILGAAVQDVPADEGNTAGRWVVFSSESMLDDQVTSQYPQNLALALNALDWLSQNEALVAVRSKQSQPPSLVWDSRQQQAAYKWGNIAGVPLLVAAYGAFRLYRRRRYSLA